MPAETAVRLTLNSESVAALANVFGDTDLLRALSLNRYHRTLLKFLALRKRLLLEHAGLCAQLGFDNACELLLHYAPSVQRHVLGYPTFSIWMDLLVPLLADAGMPPSGLADSLAQIWRFVMACASHANVGEFHCTVPVHRDRRLFLPGTHSYLEFNDPLAEVRVHVSGASVTCFHGGGGRIDPCKSQVLYNLHRVTGEEAIIVEGFFDCMKVSQSANPGVVALMGNSLSEHQEKLLVERFKKVTLLLDGDQAGRGAVYEAVSRLVHRVYVRVVDVPDGKQPDQLTDREITQLLR